MGFSHALCTCDATHIVAQGVSVRISLHPHAIHDVICLSVRLLSLRGSLSSFSLFSTLPLSVNTTPQMTCFRVAKVCPKWLQGQVMMTTRWEFGHEVENSEVEKPELSMAWWHCLTRTPMTTSMLAWHCMTAQLRQRENGLHRRVPPLHRLWAQGPWLLRDLSRALGLGTRCAVYGSSPWAWVACWVLTEFLVASCLVSCGWGNVKLGWGVVSSSFCFLFWQVLLQVVCPMLWCKFQRNFDPTAAATGRFPVVTFNETCVLPG